MKNKVLCVGYQKTGTSSLKAGLEVLGYNVAKSNTKLIAFKENGPKIVEQYVHDFDAFQDIPWCKLYKEFDAAHQDFKFVLTTRAMNSRIESMKNYFGKGESKMRTLIYEGVGSPIGNEEHYKEMHQKHIDEVLSYFKDRPDDLLILDIKDENKREKLCPFLGLKIPNQEYPHTNKGNYTMSGKTRKSVLNTIVRFKKFFGKIFLKTSG